MFRFTIRDLLWLTVVVAVVLCWFITYRESIFSAEARTDLATQIAPLQVQVFELKQENEALRAELRSTATKTDRK